MKKCILLIVLTLSLISNLNSQSIKSNFLYRIQNADERCGYVNKKGDTVVQMGKYLLCQDSVIKEIGFVYSNQGIYCINNKGIELFEVFNYDNGPDYPSEGLFRIIKDGKIGYANNHGKIVIEPKYKCAWPFEKGLAKVSYNCNIVKNEEHNLWKGGEWFSIDKKGKVVVRY
jgi:hypothetical protein